MNNFLAASTQRFKANDLLCFYQFSSFDLFVGVTSKIQMCHLRHSVLSIYFYSNQRFLNKSSSKLVEDLPFFIFVSSACYFFLLHFVIFVNNLLNILLNNKNNGSKHASKSMGLQIKIPPHSVKFSSKTLRNNSLKSFWICGTYQCQVQFASEFTKFLQLFHLRDLPYKLVQTSFDIFYKCIEHY